MFKQILSIASAVSVSVLAAGVASAESYVTNQWSNSNMHVDATSNIHSSYHFNGQRVTSSEAFKIEPLGDGQIIGTRDHFAAPKGFAAAGTTEVTHESYRGHERVDTTSNQRGYVTVNEHRVSAGNN